MARKPPKIQTEFVNPPSNQRKTFPQGDPAPDIVRLTGGNIKVVDSVPPPVSRPPEAAPTPAAPAYDPYAAMMAAQEANRRTNAIAVIRGLLQQYGLESLYNTIVGYVQDGYDADSVMALIRTTPEYKQRFPAMEELSKKGRAITEAQYIAYEKEAAGLERQYGLPAGMLGKDAITNLLTKEVSARELEERVVLAAAGAFQTTPEVQRTFQEYYGIGPGGLTAYFLDPDVATPLLNKQYVSSRIGAEAARQDISVDKSLSELLQLEGVTADEARVGFGKVAEQRALTAGRGDVVSQRQLIGANLQGDVAAQMDVERAQLARTGAFQGGGTQFMTTQAGPVGLRSAAT